MRKLNKNKGITLIALIITIIVMLILVGVTISMAVNGGLFNYAGKATGDTQNEINAEKELANGRIKVDGVWYDSIDKYLAKEPSENQGEGTGTGSTMKNYEETEKDTTTGVLKANAEYKSGDYPAVIPKGFKVIPGINGTTTVADGLVIQDAEGNEFVWIPVAKAIVTENEITAIKKANSAITTDLEAVQNLVNSGTYPMAVQVGENYKGILYTFSGRKQLTVTVEDWTSTSSYREPANLSTAYDSATRIDAWTETLYQKAYDEMVKSVANNGGFYVGRYEISEGTYTLEAEGTIKYAQSQSGKTPIKSTIWHDLYEYESNYAKYNEGLGVSSEMIWGSQWDQMMIFVNGKDDGEGTEFYVTQTGHRSSGDSSIKTGENTVDQVANIFDLEAGMREWTQEAFSSDSRVLRSYSDYSYGTAKREGEFIFSVNNSMSSRLALYIK